MTLVVLVRGMVLCSRKVQYAVAAYMDDVSPSTTNQDQHGNGGHKRNTSKTGPASITPSALHTERLLRSQEHPSRMFLFRSTYRPDA